MSSDYVLLLTALVLAVLDWVAVARNSRRAELVLKPAVMLTLIAWVWQLGGFSGWMAWIGVGLIFALLGDIFLLWPAKLFPAGMLAFFLTYILYFIGFSPTAPPANAVTLILLILIAAAATTLYRHVSVSLRQHDNPGLILPSLAFTIAISLMVFAGVSTLARPEWNAVSAILVSFGAISLLASDSLLSWNKFVRPVQNSRVLVMVTYHLGQIMIVLGAAWHYLPL